MRADDPSEIHHLVHVAGAVVSLTRLGEVEVFKEVGLKCLAFRIQAHEVPFLLRAAAERKVGVVIHLTGLRRKENLAEPAECRHPCLGFRHVPRRPLPSLVTDEPPDRAALEVLLVVRPEHPRGHAVDERDLVALGLVSVPSASAGDEPTHGCGAFPERHESAFELIFRLIVLLIQPEHRPGHVGDDVGGADFGEEGLTRLDGRHDLDLLHRDIGEGFERGANPRRVIRSERARVRRIRNRLHVLFRPLPCRTTIGRLPRLPPHRQHGRVY